MAAEKQNPIADADVIEQFVALNQQRISMYALLSRIYAKEVDEALLTSLRGTRFPISTGVENTDTGNKMIAKYLSNTWENTLTELAVDYSRSFIGHGVDARGCAYPVESVYTSEKRLMMQDARDEVLSIYRSEGIEKNGGWKEDEDHISAEFEFMKILIERMCDALRSGDEEKADTLLTTQKNFFDDHIASWVPLFTEDLRTFSKTDFYQGFAYVTDGFLEAEGEFLADAVDE